MKKERKGFLGYQDRGERCYSTTFSELGRNDVALSDIVKIATPEQSVKLTFISKNAVNRQGVCLAIFAGKGEVEVETDGLKRRQIVFWEDTNPKEVLCKCRSNKGLLTVYNFWDHGNWPMSLLPGAGMLIKEEGNKRTYYCNDVGLETNFDKLVFSIELL